MIKKVTMRRAPKRVANVLYENAIKTTYLDLMCDNISQLFASQT